MERLFILSYLFLFNFVVNSQQLTEKDKKIIKYEAEMFIKEYELLLNGVTSSELNLYELKELIENSYKESANKIFLNADVIIEDDIDPNSYSNQHIKDLKVDRYLSNLDLFYSKSSSSTIFFDSVQWSDVKQEDYIYLEVYFRSHFKGSNHNTKTTYTTTERVATIITRKERNLWKMAIASIVYFDPIKYPFVKKYATKNTVANTELIKTLDADTSFKVVEEKYFNNTKALPKTPLFLASGLGLLSLGSSIYFRSKANESYRDYQEATKEENIKNFRSDTQQFDRLTVFSGITFGISAIYYLIYKRAYKKSTKKTLTVQLYQPTVDAFGLHISKTF